MNGTMQMDGRLSYYNKETDNLFFDLNAAVKDMRRKGGTLDIEATGVRNPMTEAGFETGLQIDFDNLTEMIMDMWRFKRCRFNLYVLTEDGKTPELKEEYRYNISIQDISGFLLNVCMESGEFTDLLFADDGDEEQAAFSYAGMYYTDNGNGHTVFGIDVQNGKESGVRK